MPGKIKSHSLTTRIPVSYVCKGIIWAIIVQEPCGLINTVYVLFSSWFWKPGYFPGEKVMAMLSEIPPDKTVSHGDHLLLWILISPHTWHNTVCAAEISAWGRQAGLPSSFKLVQYRCDIFHKVLVPLIKTKRTEQLSHSLRITILQHLLLTSRKLLSF